MFGIASQSEWIFYIFEALPDQGNINKLSTIIVLSTSFNNFLRIMGETKLSSF